jgi:predicted nucleic acid-binding protein
VILVDSSVWIEYFNGVVNPQTDRLDDLLGSEPLAIGDLILTEVLQGFIEDAAFEKARRLLLSLTIVDLGGKEIAILAARHFRMLRKRGITVRKTIDLLIATRCIESGYQLLHCDRDFDPFVKYLGLSFPLSLP